MSHLKTPLVSILTPSFNQDRWIVHNLQSVQLQTYPRIQQIVMDGGSTDGTKDILANAADNVDWTSESDQGQSHALNKAFLQSSGDILGWINSDDGYADRRAVARAVEVFERYPDVGVVYGHGLVVSEDNRVMHALWSPKFSDALLERGVLMLQPSVFIRRSLIVGPLVREDLNFVMDWDLFVRLRRSGAEFRRIELVVGIDRHQRQRKTLQGEAFESEVLRYSGELGHAGKDRTARLARKATTVSKRLRGLPLAATMAGSVDAAMDLQFESTARRVFQQAILPRRAIKQV